MKEESVFSTSRRLISIDAFRGFTIIGMIIVNSPGDWGNIYGPLEHAKWNGITFTDIIFPFFLFIVGISIVLAYSKRLDYSIPKARIIRKIIIRALLLFLIGIILNVTSGELTDLRIAGVLQRIAIVFLICALLFLYTNWKQQAIIGGITLLFYWLAMITIPVPNIGSGIIEPGKNLAAWIDSILLPGKKYNETWDPEGILSTFPAIVTGITGMLVGHLFISNRPQEKKLNWLFFGGFCSFLLGGIWNWFFPINKNLWSSSYVLYTSGLASMTLASTIWIIDFLNYRKWAAIAVIFGTNAITAYIFHCLLKIPIDFIRIGDAGTSINMIFMQALQNAGFSSELASFIWAILYTSICFIPVWIMYRRKIFLKI